MQDSPLFYVFYLSRPNSRKGSSDGCFMDYTHPRAVKLVNQEYGNLFRRIVSKEYRDSRRQRYSQIRFNLRSQIRFLLGQYGAERVKIGNPPSKTENGEETEGILITGSNESDILTKKALISKGLEKILETRVIF